MCDEITYPSPNFNGAGIKHSIITVVYIHCTNNLNSVKLRLSVHFGSKLIILQLPSTATMLTKQLKSVHSCWNSDVLKRVMKTFELKWFIKALNLNFKPCFQVYLSLYSLLHWSLRSRGIPPCRYPPPYFSTNNGRHLNTMIHAVSSHDWLYNSGNQMLKCECRGASQKIPLPRSPPQSPKVVCSAITPTQSIVLFAIFIIVIGVMVGLINTLRPGRRLNIKTVLSTYGDFHVKDKTAVRTSYL